MRKKMAKKKPQKQRKKRGHKTRKKYRLTIKNSARILIVKRYKNRRKFYRFPICKNATLPGTKISKSKEAIRARISNRAHHRGHEIRPALLRGASPSQSRNSY